MRMPEGSRDPVIDQPPAQNQVCAGEYSHARRILKNRLPQEPGHNSPAAITQEPSGEKDCKERSASLQSDLFGRKKSGDERATGGQAGSPGS
jgi:hypothetical protein